MASNQTANLGLSQWEADDEVLRADFNSDNAKLDAAVGTLRQTDTALQTAVNGKANASAVTALTQTVNGKADVSAVTALAGQVSALAAKYGPDNLPWVTGSYTGNAAAVGTTQDITLGFRPRLLIVLGNYGIHGIGVTHNGTSFGYGTYNTAFGMEPDSSTLVLTDTGFRVKRVQEAGYSLNHPDFLLIYFALR